MSTRRFWFIAITGFLVIAAAVNVYRGTTPKLNLSFGEYGRY